MYKLIDTTCKYLDPLGQVAKLVYTWTPLAPEPWQGVGSDHSGNPSVKMENMQSDCKEWEEKDAAATSYFIT